MSKLSRQADLKSAIHTLELKQANDRKNLKTQFEKTFEALKPTNLIKSTFKEMTESVELKNSLVNTTVGLTAGYLAKILFQSVSHSPLKKMIGSALLIGITNIVSKNPKAIQTVLSKTIGLMRTKSISASARAGSNQISQ
jgi:hypothetical protein